MTWGSMVPSSDREFHEKLANKKEEIHSVPHPLRFPTSRISSPKLTPRSPTGVFDTSLSRLLLSQSSDELPTVNLEIPKEISRMRTSTRVLWDIFLEVMAINVPDPLPHLNLRCPKKAQKPNSQSTSLAKPLTEQDPQSRRGSVEINKRRKSAASIV